MYFKEYTIQEFVHILSSKSPVPGGGGAASLSASLGCALGSMTANLTLGKKKFELYEEDNKILLEKLSTCQEELLEFIDRDAAAFEPLSKAYKLPKNTKEEIQYKVQVMEAALLDASLIPIKIMEKSIEALSLLTGLSKHCSKMAVSDIAVGAQFLRSSIAGASINVYINTASMQNRELAEQLNQKADILAAEGTKQADQLFQDILNAINIH